MSVNPSLSSRRTAKAASPQVYFCGVLATEMYNLVGLRQIATPPFWVVFLFGHIVGFEVDLQKRKVSVAAFLNCSVNIIYFPCLLWHGTKIPAEKEKLFSGLFLLARQTGICNVKVH